MGKIHGLAVLFLIIFEGTIIQCTPNLPRSISDKINGGANLRELFEDYILVISSFPSPSLPQEYYGDDNGELFLSLGNFPNLKLFFATFGEHITKIKIIYPNESDGQNFNKFVKNIIVSRGNNLELLMIENYVKNGGVWSALTNDGNYIVFQNVNFFEYRGNIERAPFKLDPMFPKLESLRLHGELADADCLANVNRLKELQLFTSSIQANQLRAIFEMNPNIINVSLYEPKAETMRSIATILTDLRTLKVWNPDMDFFYGTNNGERLQLPSVEHLWIKVRDFTKIVLNGDVTFDMPNLKRLTIRVVYHIYRAYYPSIDFVRHFESLERIDFYIGEKPILWDSYMPHWARYVQRNFVGTEWTCDTSNEWAWYPLVFKRQLNNE